MPPIAAARLRKIYEGKIIAGGAFNPESATEIISIRWGQSQCPDDVHQVVDFSDSGGSTRTQVVLHTESCKKGQDQSRKGVRIHLWALNLNILGDEPL
jgi:hypothetical protein